ncbi:DedA family protein [Leptospira sp. GIMC2001]|uniref:DedA family protein n=1 Tax=Leptospira sp. GIMC2001 TaxID=1513297 RepID=UPI00234956CC|nr:DedA family protein [Leptospira sp. GIMC2001]WCL50941.1 DedA family protein [Leptospira sp. GIMC2001]
MELLTELVTFFSGYGYWAVFGILIACGFGLPVPEDISLVAGGVISGLGFTNVHIMFAVGMAGVMIGDTAVFLVGSRYGERALKIKFIARILTQETFDKVREKFEKYGIWVVFFGRFMPGLRMPIYFSAGTSGRVGLIRFFVTDFLAAMISVPIWVYLGYFGANNFDELLGWVRQSQITLLITIGVILIALIAFYYLKKSITKKI